MRELESRGLHEAIVSAAANKPFLGICIGLQLLFEHSEEGDANGLGILAGKVKRFSAEEMHDANGDKLKVPHMGWNTLETKNSELYNGISSEENFYFVHSYYAEISQETTAVCDYIVPFSASMQKNNFYATQFHPEKSSQAGEQLLLNFLKL